ncbi:hypothetical protein FAIPA1_240090 [Frankia sp. AiPs1]
MSVAVPSASIASDGPLDGQRLGDPKAASFEVVMADRSRHVYRATATLESAPDGALCRVFEWAGRATPPTARPAD